MNEQFKTVAEVAEMLGVSKDTVRRLFADEPGVIDLGRHEATRGKRQYRDCLELLVHVADCVSFCGFG